MLPYSVLARARTKQRPLTNPSSVKQRSYRCYAEPRDCEHASICASVTKCLRDADIFVRYGNLPVEKSLLIFWAPYYFGARGDLLLLYEAYDFSSHAEVSGVPLESSGRRYSSTRSMNIRLNL